MAGVRLSQSPVEPSFVQDPYSRYRDFRRHRVFWWEEYEMWVFPRFEDVSAIFRDRRFGREILHVATRKELGWPPVPDHLRAFEAFEAASLLEREPPEHTRLRRLVNRAFVSRNIASLAPKIEALSGKLAENLRPGDDLIEKYCTPIPVTMIAELLGVPADAAPRLLKWSHQMVAMYQARRDHGIEVQAEQATRAFSAFILEQIEERRLYPRADLLSALVSAHQDEDRLTESELISTCILVLNAGHEATVHAIGNSIRVLAQRPEHQDPLRIPGMVEELMRIDPPLHMFTRYVLKDLEWGGIALRKGEQVGLLIGSANHDECATPDPSRFDPGRQRVQHVSLGAGAHFCLGAPLARMELGIALRVLFETLGREPDLTIDPYADTYHFHGISRIGLN